MKRKIAVVLFALGMYSSMGFSQKLDTPKLDSFFNRLSRYNKTMGSVALLKNGKIVYARTFGYSQVNDHVQAKADANTVYQVGSITKMFTAAMIFQLVEEGKLSLATDLSVYFPAIPGAKDITVGMLLGHKSGLYDFGNDVADPRWILKHRTRAEILDTIINGPRHFAPGAGTEYSNSGYWLLGWMIEQVTHRSYNENLQERICKKLNLTKTFVCAGGQLPANVARPYVRVEKKWKDVPEIHASNIVGAGDIISTPKELIVFEESLMKGKVVSAQSLQSMIGDKDSSYGMGIMNIPFDGKMSHGHAGDTRGTHSIVFYYPGDSLTMAICMNGEGYLHSDVIYALPSICFNKNYDIPSFKEVKIPLPVLKGYEGVYAGPELPFKITISQKKGVLYAQAPEQAPFALEAQEQDMFRYMPAKIVLVFDAAKHQMTMYQHGSSFVLSKE